MGDYILAGTAEVDENRMIRTPGAINGGFFEKSADNAHPSLTIAVDDIQAHIEKVKKGGGKVLGEPVEIPGIGMYVSIIDTEGNRVSMLQPTNRRGPYRHHGERGEHGRYASVGTRAHVRDVPGRVGTGSYAGPIMRR